MNHARTFSALVLFAMIAITTAASLESNVVEGFRYLFLDKWGIATLMDAYFGFLFFYLWIFYRERTAFARIGWLVAVLSFGTIAMACYLLLAIRSVPKGASLDDVLRRKSA